MNFNLYQKYAIAWANDGKFPWTDFVVQSSEADFIESKSWMVLTTNARFGHEKIYATLTVHMPEDSVEEFQLELE